MDEARWTLARDGARAWPAPRLADAEAAVAAARAAADRRPRPSWPPSASAARQAEEALVVAVLGARARCRRASTPPARRPSGSACAWTPRRAPRPSWPSARRAAAASISRLEAEAEADVGDDGAAERIAALQAELDAARRGLQDAPGARAGRARGAPRGRHRAGRRARRAGRRAPPRAAARAKPPPRPPARPAASSTPPPRRPAANPPASAPSSRRSTSSCAPTPAPRAAPPRSPTSCPPPRATSSP